MERPETFPKQPEDGHHWPGSLFPWPITYRFDRARTSPTHVTCGQSRRPAVEPGSRSGLGRIGFGRAVSRILSAPCGGENHLSMQPIPGIRPLSRNWDGPPRGFPIWPCTRWGFPCRVACASRGALLPHLFTITAGLRRRLSVFCGTVRRNISRPSARVYPGRTSPGYVASRPVEFGLSSPGLRRRRFSALPKPIIPYTTPPLISSHDSECFSAAC